MRALLRTLALSLALAVAAAPLALAQDHGGEGGEGTEAEGAEHHAIDWNQLGWQIVDFAALVALIVYLARKPAAEFFGKRRADIADQLAEAQRLKSEAEAKYAEYQKRLQSLDAELDELRDEIVKAGEAERDRTVAEAERKASRLRKDAEFVIEQRLKQLRKDLRVEIVEAAIAAAEKTLVERTTDADHEKLAKEFVASLGPLAKSGKVTS